MKILLCPDAYYSEDGREILCKVRDDLCGHVHFCQLQNRWKHSEQALKCPARSDMQKKEEVKPKKKAEPKKKAPAKKKEDKKDA